MTLKIRPKGSNSKLLLLALTSLCLFSSPSFARITLQSTGVPMGVPNFTDDEVILVKRSKQHLYTVVTNILVVHNKKPKSNWKSVPQDLKLDIDSIQAYDDSFFNIKSHFRDGTGTEFRYNFTITSKSTGTQYLGYLRVPVTQGHASRAQMQKNTVRGCPYASHYTTHTHTHSGAAFSETSSSEVASFHTCAVEMKHLDLEEL